MAVAPHEQVKNGNVVKFLKDYWFIFVFIVSASILFAELRGQILANQTINTTQQGQIEETAASVNALDKKYIEDIAVIKTKLEQLTQKTK